MAKRPAAKAPAIANAVSLPFMISSSVGYAKLTYDRSFIGADDETSMTTRAIAPDNSCLYLALLAGGNVGDRRPHPVRILHPRAHDSVTAVEQVTYILVDGI